MANLSYLYSFRYDYHNTELCKLESRQLFVEEDKNQLLFSDIKIDPSISPFIKTRLEIIASSDSYTNLLQSIKNKQLEFDGFKVEYMRLKGDTIEHSEKRQKLIDIGYCINGAPDFKNPWITYSLCNYQNKWLFGIIAKHDTSWYRHIKKPHSFSSSINMDIAKSLVAIASKGNINKRLLDACCGVGTVMLEACISDFNIEGCDINLKACNHTRENLTYFNYNATVYNSDIQNLTQVYDAAILDLPYNLFTQADDYSAQNIIESAAQLAPRLIIVYNSDIETLINNAGLKITDVCSVGKKGKSKFVRTIWVCEKKNDIT